MHTPTLYDELAAVHETSADTASEATYGSPGARPPSTVSHCTDVVGTRVLVAIVDRADLGTAWAVVSNRFGDHDMPSTLIGVSVLGYRDQLVGVEAIAALPNATAQR